MPPPVATGRKTPAKLKAEETITLDNMFDDLDDFKSSDVKDKCKLEVPIVEKPGNWDTKTSGGNKAKDHGERPAKPQMNSIPSMIAKAFKTGQPMTDNPDIVKCNHCKRPVMKHAMPGHIEQCLNKKQEKQRKKKEAKDARDAAARKERQGDSDEEEDGARKTASKNGGLTASKKRKAVDDDEQNAPFKKKKKKDDLKAKTTKVKAPVDVEKQCGVELPQGGQCARSLTCKSHSMGLKRAVPGRSAPYDKLLMEYQRKNQAKLQKAAFDANAPNPDDDSLPSGPVDSEEEKDTVMSAISRSWGGQPIYEQTHVPLRGKYEYNRIKSMLTSALSGRGGTGLFGSGSGGGGGTSTAGIGGGFFGSALATTTDVESIMHARKGSIAPGGRSMMVGSRKPSVASTGIVT